MITAIHCLKIQSHIMIMFCLLDRTIQICVSCIRAVKICFFGVQFSHTYHWMFNMAPHGKELSKDLRIRIAALQDGLGYKKFGNSLRTELQYSGQVHTEVFKDGFHEEEASQGSIKEVESLCCASGAEAGFKKQTYECCQHCFRGCRSGRSACQCSDHTPHTATSRFAWLHVVPEGSLF